VNDCRKLSTFFPVRTDFKLNMPHNTKLTLFQKQKKRPRSPSPDRNVLSDPEQSASDHNLTLDIRRDGDIVFPFEEDELTSFYFNEAEMVLTGQQGSAFSDVADALYGVKSILNLSHIAQN
jgi:hypothetical protein